MLQNIKAKVVESSLITPWNLKWKEKITKLTRSFYKKVVGFSGKEENIEGEAEDLN